jgi:hypothetical protein
MYAVFVGIFEKILVSAFIAGVLLLFPFLESIENFSDRKQNAGIVAYFAPCVCLSILGISVYFHAKEEFKDHVRFIISALGFPSLIYTLISASRIAFGG